MIYFTIYVKQTSIICSCTYILPKIRGIVSAIIGVVIIGIALVDDVIVVDVISVSVGLVDVIIAFCCCHCCWYCE